MQKCILFSQSEIYPMTGKGGKRGKTIIFNQRKDRPGTDIDVETLTRLYSQLNYECRVHNDTTKQVKVIACNYNVRHNMFILPS